jgi:hypothetical protein
MGEGEAGGGRRKERRQITILLLQDKSKVRRHSR